MVIIKRLADGLCSPSQVLKYRNDRNVITVFVYFILSLMLMVPSIISVFNTPFISYDMKTSIKNVFRTSEEIPYVISGGKLEFANTSGSEAYQYIINVDEMCICFTTQNSLAASEDLKTTRVIFMKDGVYLQSSVFMEKVMNYYEYLGTEGLDFRKAKINDRTFWDDLFKITNDVLDNYKTTILISQILIVVFQSLASVALGSLILTAINRFGMNNIYSFSVHWKLMMYYMVPYVFGTILATLFNANIFNYIGLIVTLIYSFKVNQINFLGGNDNEL